MPHTTAQTPAQQAPPRRAMPRMRQHAMGAEGSDPMSLAKRKPIMAPGNAMLILFMCAFGLYATGHLSGFDSFFDHLHNFGRTHNDIVVRIVVRYLPAALVISAAAVLAWMGAKALLRRSGSARHGRVDRRVLETAMADAVRASTMQSEKPFGQKIGKAEAPVLSSRLAALAGRDVSVEHSLIGAELPTLHSDTTAVTDARAATGVQTASALHDSESDSVPTLPLHTRVRRPGRRTLPPHIAAKLKITAAAQQR